MESITAAFKTFTASKDESLLTNVFQDSSVLLGLDLPTNQSTTAAFGSIYSQLKPLESLNWIEKIWATYYIGMGNDIFATGLLFFCLHEFMYFGRSLPWFIIDRTPYFQKFKIQETKMPSNKEQWECLKSVLTSHFLVELFPIWFFHPLCEKIGISYSVPFPSLLTMLLQISLFFVLEDAWHYWFHRGLHHGVFYKYIHKQHHRYLAPFGLAAEYLHPLEVMLLGMGTVGIPIVWCYFTRNLHLFTICIWITLRLYQAVDAHSGYEFPVSLHHFLPFWAGLEHHDEHHHHFIGNYASSFRFWDFVLDTEAGLQGKQSRERKMKQKAEKKVKTI